MKKHSFEAFWLIYFPVIGALLVMCAAFFKNQGSFSFFEAIAGSTQSFLVYFKFKTIIFFAPFLIIFISITLFFLGQEVLFAFFFEKNMNIRRAAFRECVRHGRMLVGMCCKILCPLVFISTAIGVATFWISHEHIARASAWLMDADRAVFGLYPTLWFQSTTNAFKSFFDTTAPIFFFTYNFILPMITITLLLFLFCDGRRLKVFLLSFVLSTYCAMPIWFFLPAVTPNDAFINKDAKVVVMQNDDVKRALFHYSPNSKLTDIFITFGNKSAIPSITTFPSMHVAWGFLIAILLFGWRWYVGLFEFLWEGVNILATVYTMQHYALDALAGICVALLGYWCARKIVRRDVVLFPHSSPTAFLQENIKKAVAILRVNKKTS